MSPTTFGFSGAVRSISGASFAHRTSVILKGGLDNKNTALETLAAIAQERAAIGN